MTAIRNCLLILARARYDYDRETGGGTEERSQNFIHRIVYFNVENNRKQRAYEVWYGLETQAGCEKSLAFGTRMFPRQLGIPDCCGQMVNLKARRQSRDVYDIGGRFHRARIARDAALPLLLHYSFGRRQRRSINNVSSCCRRTARRLTKDITLLALSGYFAAASGDRDRCSARSCDAKFVSL